MKLAIRADGDAVIGTGHLSRCRTIALECLRRRHDICFFSKEGAAPWLEQYGVPFETLPVCGNIVAETDAFIVQAKHWGADWALVDSYSLDEESYRHIHAAFRSMVIDDYARLPYEADILLNANLYAPTLDYSHASVKELLLGREYAILRDEFRKVSPAPFRKEVRRILVTMGGSDINSYTPFVLSALQDIEVPEILVIMGAYARCMEEVRAAAEACKSPVRILQAPPNMAELFASCDMGISAAGSTVYELCAMGVPSVLIEQAENQHLIFEYFKECPAMIPAGDYRSLSSSALRAAASLLQDPGQRKRAWQAALTAVERAGVENIVEFFR